MSSLPNNHKKVNCYWGFNNYAYMGIKTAKHINNQIVTWHLYTRSSTSGTYGMLHLLHHKSYTVHAHATLKVDTVASILASAWAILIVHQMILGVTFQPISWNRIPKGMCQMYQRYVQIVLGEIETAPLLPRYPENLPSLKLQASLALVEITNSLSKYVSHHFCREIRPLFASYPHT